LAFCQFWDARKIPLHLILNQGKHQERKRYSSQNNGEANPKEQEERRATVAAAKTGP